MEKSNIYLDEWNRKDAEPKDSINFFMEILNSVGMETEIKDVKNYKGLWYSCRVVFSDLPQLGTNGKGVSKEYAIASAYGELFERLQSDTLISEYFPSKNRDADIVISDLDKVCQILKKYLPHVFGLLSDTDICSMLEHCPNYQSFSEYYSVEDNSTVLLPDKLIYFLCGTNGISAGNSYEEACTQGISEIFERYVMRQLHLNGNSADQFPNVSDACLQHTKSFELISAIRNKGYECYIKDCTLGGRFPVMGVLVMDNLHTKYCFSLGCDLNLDICLQRCITEIFQGFDFDVTFRMQMNSFFEHEENWWKFPVDVKKGLVKSIFDGTGRLPFYLLDTKTYKKANKLKPFENGKMSNFECLERLLKILKELGKRLYIRNCNYLGVPALRMYVPGISDAFLYDYPLLELINAIYRIKNGITDEMSQIDRFQDLSLIIGYPTYSNNASIAKLCGVLYNNPENREISDVHYLYACMALNLGRYETAKEYFKSSYSVHYGMKAKLYIDYMSCIIDAIEYNIPKAQVKELLIKNQDDDAVAVLIDKLYRYRQRGITNMKCMDCDSCMFLEGCIYNEWRRLYEKYCNAKKLRVEAFAKFAENISKVWCRKLF